MRARALALWAVLAAVGALAWDTVHPSLLLSVVTGISCLAAAVLLAALDGLRKWR